MIIRFCTLTAALLLALPAWADHDSLDEAFERTAPKILAALKERKCENVGVLKFQVQKGTAKPSDAVGELNNGLSDRLEASLILATDDEKLGIIHRASAAVVANKNRLANHLTEEGRQAFFADKYRLAWGDAKVKPSGFITGLATISPDLKTVSIQFQYFGEEGKLEKLLDPIEVATSRRTLVEAGYSYVLTEKNSPKLFDGARGGKGGPQGKLEIKAEDEAASKETVVLANTVEGKSPRQTAESALAESPVKLTVKYGNNIIPVEGDRIREPAEGDKVSFLLENTDPKNLYAVVLKVNGKNTLFSEDAEPAQCLKWILDKGAKLEITGFQESDTESVPFKILSAAESEENVMTYGDLVGTLRLVVYRGEQVSEDPSTEEKKTPEPRRTMLAAVSRGVKGTRKGDEKPGSLAALRADLLGRQKELEGQRGVIDKSGAKEASSIQKIFFRSLPTVGVADVTIRYYTPKGK